MISASSRTALMISVAYALWLVAVDVLRHEPLITFALIALAVSIGAFALPRSWWIFAVVMSVGVECSSLAAPTPEQIVRLIAMPIAAFGCAWFAALVRRRILPGEIVGLTAFKWSAQAALGSSLGGTSWLIVFAIIALVLGDLLSAAASGASFVMVVVVTLMLWRDRRDIAPFPGFMLLLGAMGSASAVGIAAIERSSIRPGSWLANFGHLNMAWPILFAVMAGVALQYIVREMMQRRAAR